MAVQDIEAIGRAFGIPGTLEHAEAFGNGHIHDTFRAEYRDGNQGRVYLHQRLNESVFPDLETLMDNLRRVTEHLAHARQHSPSSSDHRRTLQVVVAPTGQPLVRDAQGRGWRTYPFVTNSASEDRPRDAAQARDAARVCGEFFCAMQRLPAPPLRPTIEGFHDTEKRLRSLHESLTEDPHQRASAAQPEIEFVSRVQSLAAEFQAMVQAGGVPVRLTHNDTKFNNVLFDATTREALCLVDLDTVMAGHVTYDVGELVRTTVSLATEDDRDEAKNRIREDILDAVLDGYLAAAGPELTPEERATFGLAGPLMALENGVRFLTDFLQGDVYFKVRDERHNLRRARAQFQLYQGLVEQRPRLERRLREARTSR